MTQEIINIIKIALGMMVPVVAVSVLVCIIKTKKSFSLAKETGSYIEAGIRLTTLILSVVSLGLWVAFADIYRIVLTAMGVPLIHWMLFVIVNNLAAKRVKKSKVLYISTLMSFLVFIAFYVMFPGGNVAGNCNMCLFGLITDPDTIAYISEVSFYVLRASMVIMIIQTIMMIVINGRKTTENIEAVISNEPSIEDKTNDIEEIKEESDSEDATEEVTDEASEQNEEKAEEVEEVK